MRYIAFPSLFQGSKESKCVQELEVCTMNDKCVQLGFEPLPSLLQSPFLNVCERRFILSSMNRTTESESSCYDSLMTPKLLTSLPVHCLEA